VKRENSSSEGSEDGNADPYWGNFNLIFLLFLILNNFSSVFQCFYVAALIDADRAVSSVFLFYCLTLLEMNKILTLYFWYKYPKQHMCLCTRIG